MFLIQDILSQGTDGKQKTCVWEIGGQECTQWHFFIAAKTGNDLNSHQQ
jgi:hypothetical protein